VVVGHLGALVPGERASQTARELAEEVDEPVSERLCPRSTVDVHQQREAAGAFNQRPDRGAVERADDQVAFRKGGDRPGGSGVAEVALRFGR